LETDSFQKLIPRFLKAVAKLSEALRQSCSRKSSFRKL